MRGTGDRENRNRGIEIEGEIERRSGVSGDVRRNQFDAVHAVGNDVQREIEGAGGRVETHADRRRIINFRGEARHARYRIGDVSRKDWAVIGHALERIDADPRRLRVGAGESSDDGIADLISRGEAVEIRVEKVDATVDAADARLFRRLLEARKASGDAREALGTDGEGDRIAEETAQHRGGGAAEGAMA